MPMSLLRRHRILEADVRRVIAHLKAHGSVKKTDTISRPSTSTKKTDIPWVHEELAGSWQRPELKAGPSNRAELYAKEGDTWKLVVPQERIETYLRSALLDPKSTRGDGEHYHFGEEFGTPF